MTSFKQLYHLIPVTETSLLLAAMLLFVGMFASGCNVQSSTSTSDSEVREAIEANNQQFMEAWQAGDAQAIASMYTDDPRFLAPHMDPLEGREAVAGFIQGNIDQGVARIDLETREVEVYGDVANEIGSYTIYTPDDQVIDQDKYIVIWRQQDGEWRLHWDMINTSMPPPEE